MASQDGGDPGVLVLSRFAGAAAKLKGAVIVNLYDIDAISEAVEQGRDMPLKERREHWESMMAPVLANTARHGHDRFTRALDSVLVNSGRAHPPAPT